MKLIITLHTPETPPGKEVQAFVHKHYRIHYGVIHFPRPWRWCTARRATDGVLVAAIGIYRAIDGILAIERYFPAEYIKRHTRNCPRNALYEVGSRVVDTNALPPHITAEMCTLYLLRAALAHVNTAAQAYLSVLFTGDRIVGRYARRFGVSPIALGTPDLTRCDKAYVRRWSRFFAQRRICYTVNITKEEG